MMGTPEVLCVSGTTTAGALLESTRETVPGLTVARDVASARLLCVHLTKAEHWDSLVGFLDQLGVGAKVFLSCPVFLRKWVAKRVQEYGAMRSMVWHRSLMQHDRVGGLSHLGCCIFWAEVGRGDCSAPSFTDPINPKEFRRNPTRFLEPSVHLDIWREPSAILESVWDPELGHLSSPLCSHHWVCARTVFLGGRLIVRPLTDKEISQCLDIREDWKEAARTTWEHLKGTDVDPFPCRIGTETLLSKYLWWSEGMAEAPDTSQTGWERPRSLVRVAPGGFLRQSNFPGCFVEPGDAMNITVAAKADEAAADYSMWNVGGTGLEFDRARASLREFGRMWWYQNLTQEANLWLSQRLEGGMDPEDVIKSLEVMTDCLARARRSDWFEWNDGSRLFFWRWPEESWREARDGMNIFHYYLPPRRTRTRVIKAEGWMHDLMAGKLRKYFRRRYIVKRGRSDIRVPIVFFPVQKGDTDIRIVWSETETGVNPATFAPTFFLPNSGTCTRRMWTGVYIGDFDVGEMFYNFPLNDNDQHLHGVLLPEDLWHVFGCTAGVWTRPPMGFTPSPYLAGRLMMLAIEYAKGNPNDPRSPFRFSEVKLNLPGMTDYDPSKPRVLKLTIENTITGEVIVYVDDGRCWGRDEAQTVECMRYLCSRLEYLGIQDAKRKRRPVSQRPGAWAGGVVYSDQGVLRKFLSQKRWDKGKTLTRQLLKDCRNSGSFDRKFLLSARGFLVYVSMLYEFLTPYLKGLHLSAESWREGRDEEGWKASDNPGEDWDQVIRQMEEAEELVPDGLEVPDEDELDEPIPLPETKAPSDGEANPPPVLEAVPQCLDDLLVLDKFFESDTPLMMPVRPNRSVALFYGFGDASGEGFGSSVSDSKHNKSRIRRGFWCTAISERSSNYREFRNLSEMVRDMHEAKGLEGCEVWIFTDNKVAELVFAKGNSSNRLLFDMMIELRLFALQAGFILHVVHVAGTRMIEEGTDGLSRGELHLGGLTNEILQIVPLHLDPLARSKALMPWLRSWFHNPGQPLRVAEPVDWPHEAHQPTHTWVWNLPPAAAIYALEELSMARLKREDRLSAVVLVPFLLSPEWFRRFSRLVDVYFFVRPGAPFWPPGMHEPLLIGFCFPLLRGEPWSWKRASFMVELGRTLSRLHKKDCDAGRNLLQQLWAARHRATGMPRGVVRDLLSREHPHPFLSLSS